MPLARGPGVEISFDPGSIREVDARVFEIRLFYEGPSATCVWVWRDRYDGSVCGSMFTTKRIAVIRIRCHDMTYLLVDMWIGDVAGNWQQLEATAYRHPPGWRYDIVPSTAEAAARDLVCATLPP